MNLTEAFKALNALNEDTFSISDDGINKLSEFEQNDDLTDEIAVIDMDAESEDDLQDSYIGKVILDCSVCHSKIYKDKTEVTVDEEEGVANIGEECPYCYTSDGFKVIGEVASYNGDETEEVEPETTDDDVEVDTDDDDTLDEAVATLERPMSKMSGTLGNVLTAHKGELASVRTREDGLALLDTIEPEVTNKGYLARLRDQISKIPDRKVPELLYNVILKGDGLGTTFESLEEDVNNVNVDTDDATVSVSQDDNGTVTVQTTPKNDGTDAMSDEVIAPLSPETESEILSNELEDSEDFEGTEEIDIPIDDFDEESFDGLGESYLKSIYENVESYKSTNVTSSGNKLKVEGLIKFNSGSEKPTSFIFEAKDTTKSGITRFVGENVNITRGKKAFTIRGTVNEGKFITESFNYNYKTKDTNGKSQRIYGTLKTDKKG